MAEGVCSSAADQDRRAKFTPVSFSGRALVCVADFSAHKGISMTNQPIAHFEAASALAIVVSSNEPLLFLSEDLRVIAGSASFCRTFGIDPSTVAGRRLSELGGGEWAMPKLASLLKATASGSAQIQAYEVDLIRPDHKKIGN